uniref:Uncharacterized protein n=1 Tax=Panagrolaimus sp. JU765 TaxID=591449 RepID=A0AC34Q7D6_9BILA
MEITDISDNELEQIISDLKSEFKGKLIKIYVVNVKTSNIDLNSNTDSLIHPLVMDDLDFTHYLPKKLTPETKIVLSDENSFLYEYAGSKNGISEYKPVKCFEARFDMEDYLKLMLQFFECELNQLYFFFSNPPMENPHLRGNYLEKIKNESKDFSSHTVFRSLYPSQKVIIYGRYLSNDNVQTLVKVKQCFSLTEIELNTFDFKINEVIPSYRPIDAYKPQTRVMGIDFGASRIVVCVSRNGYTHLVKIDEEYSMPSVISFIEDKPIIGNVAKRHLEMLLNDIGARFI